MPKAQNNGQSCVNDGLLVCITQSSHVSLFVSVSRLLGEWEKAKSDLATACKIDWDDQADEWLKAATPNVCPFYVLINETLKDFAI